MTPPDPAEEQQPGGGRCDRAIPKVTAGPAANDYYIAVTIAAASEGQAQ